MSNQTKGNLVDISSNTQVLNLYKKRGRIKRIVCIALSVIFLLSGSGFVYYYSVLNSMNYVDISNDNDNTDSTLPSSSDVFGNGTSSNDLLQNSKVLNVMLFGEDNNHGDKYGRTDTMIMLSIDNIHKKIKLTSFQRDTYVYIPGNGYDKINASSTLGAQNFQFKPLKQTLELRLTDMLL